MTSTDVSAPPVPRPGSPERVEFLAEVAADAKRRRAEGGSEPPNRALAPHPDGGYRLDGAGRAISKE
ncbi:hypothetical protein K7711_11180 [Nocardia sp. CA2R105]|uniref:hypothetical protein n=1 Tax=Nocardia coffeae TaxID=2873381 RepID=UPI001CA7367C|nr:hypothetical protein [Nocardia coffeae]MBY8857041.1 hypothetical protein [Nocardia coffeae]